MNRVLLIGRLVRQPDVRYTQGQEQMAIARFTVAVDRRAKKDSEKTADFISCVAFGKLGEFVEKYLSKGTKIALEGRWQTGSYDNKEGQKVYTNDCICDHIEFAESKRQENEAQTGDDFMQIPEDAMDELPFI